MLLKFVPITRKLSQNQLYEMIGFTELPINTRLMQYNFSDLPEWVYGLEETRMFNIKDQMFTGECETYQEWYLEEAYNDY